MMMTSLYTAVIKKIDDAWIGWIEEIPGVNCQETTYEELLETLTLTLKEVIEFNREDALKAAGENYQEQKIAL
jgi:predicted RNase H-like HicB family nuclease